MTYLNPNAVNDPFVERIIGESWLGDVNCKIITAQETIDSIIADKDKYYKGASAILYGIGTYTFTPNIDSTSYTLDFVVNIEGNPYHAKFNVTTADTIIDIFLKFKTVIDTITDVFGFRFDLTCNASSITIKCTIEKPLVINSFSCTGGTITSTATAPAIIPDFAGQRYINTAQRKKYTAVSNSAASDWLED